MRRPRLLALLCLLAASMSLAAPTAAQRVDVQGRGDPLLDRRIREFLADPATRVLLDDTLLQAGDTLRGPIAAIGITLRIEGVVDGHLFIVDSNIFVRPGGIVRGTVTNVDAARWSPR